MRERTLCITEKQNGWVAEIVDPGEVLGDARVESRVFTSRLDLAEFFRDWTGKKTESEEVRYWSPKLTHQPSGDPTPDILRALIAILTEHQYSPACKERVELLKAWLFTLTPGDLK